MSMSAIAQPLRMLRPSSVFYILTLIIASSLFALSNNAGSQSSPHGQRRPAQSSIYQYAHAFATPPALCSSCRPVHSALSVSRIPNDPSFFTSFNGDDDDDDDRDNDANNSIKHAADPRTDVKSFLTQRSLQSLHYLLTATRDQVSADWLEVDFLGCEKGSQQAYHGTGAAYLHEQSQVDKADASSASFGSWQELIVSLIEQDTITKRVSLGKKYKGGEGGRRMAANSYLEGLSSAPSTGEEEISSESTDGNSPKQTNKLHNPFGSPHTADANTGTGAVPKPGQAPKSATSSYLESIGSSNSNGNTEPIDWSTMSSSSISNNSISSNESSSRGSSDVNCGLDDTFISSGSVGSVISGITSSTPALQSLPIDRDQFQRSLLSTRLGMKSRRKEKFHRSLLSTRLALESQRSRGADSTHSAPGIIDCDDSINQASASTLDNYGVAPRPTLSSDSDSNKRLGIDRERLAQDRERAFQSNSHISSDDDDYYMDLEVDPKSLATRLLAVREQIALEFVEDLTLIWKADKTLLTDLLVWTEEKGGEGVGSMPSSNAIKMHQELLASSGKASSSFRKGNLDLIFNLSTQAAIHRLLKQLMSDECIVDANCGRADRAAILSYNNACFRWLRDFYVDRVGDFFDGDVPFGRADDFFMEWLQQSSFGISDGATSKTSSTSDQGFLNKVDPLHLAEKMVRIRSDILMEWRKICRLVPEEDHGWIRLLIMEKRAEEGEGDDSIRGISGNIGLDDDFTDENGLGGFQ